MMYIIDIVIIIVLFVFLSNTTVTIKPFSIKCPHWISAVIRLLDLAGLRQLDSLTILVPKMKRELGVKVIGGIDHCLFPERIFILTDSLFNQDLSIDGKIAMTISDIEDLCDHLSIDLWLHVELKLKYNQTRPIKHGKRY